MVNSIYRFMLFKLRKSLELSQLCELFDVNAEMESELESCLNIISDELSGKRGQPAQCVISD
jgi:hypothetical protein